jgi:hypothetical protein
MVLGRRGIVRLELVDASTRRPVVTAVRVIDVRGRKGMPIRTSDGGLPPPANRFEVAPGREFRLRVDANGYEPSRIIELKYDLDNIIRDLRVLLTPDDVPKATLVLWPRYPSGRAPEDIQVRRIGLEGASTGTRPVLRDRVEFRLPAGDNELLISPGGFWSPRWVAYHLRIRLEPGETVRREITFVRGGTIVVRGPDAKVAPAVELARDGPDYRGDRTTETVNGVTWVRIGPLTPGRWTLRAPDCREAEVDLAATDTKRITLERR